MPTDREQLNPEQFIRSILVCYENDDEIKIKIANSRAKTYSAKDLGFRKTASKAWGIFVDVLRSRDHLYHVGVAYGAAHSRNKSYDMIRKRLDQISKKLVAFLNSAYQAALPDNFNIYERVKNEHSGIYRFKFTISSESVTETNSYEHISKDELIKKIEALSERKAMLAERGDEGSEENIYATEDELNAAVGIACKKGWLDYNRARSYLNPKKEQIFPSTFDNIHVKNKSPRNDY